MGKKDFTKYRPKVVVAMSGGVDSSVAAALLKKQGYEVVGVFMRFWAGPTTNYQQPTSNLCYSEGTEAAARAVAAKLKIPFYVFNFAKEFKKEVVDYFLAESAAGRTPNPCVVCNKKIKFGLLLKKALELGADYLATGHYARKTVIASPAKRDAAIPPALRRRLRRGECQIVKSRDCHGAPPLASGGAPRNDIYGLFSAKDKNKDQSYFLCGLGQEQLSRIIFPLADYKKEEVYKLAKKWKLPHRREESFDLCFTGGDTRGFIKKYLKLKPGRISDLAGKILGEHQGLALYTIGQRKNLAVSNGPWWVIKKDEHGNILYVSKNEKDLYSQELIVGGINWIGGKAPKLPFKALVKIRYRSAASAAVIRGIARRPCPPMAGKAAHHDAVRVKFQKPQRAITPGQSAVFYSKSGEVLGGGMIS
jgi:tRNA-specific 2-thiouridylase